MKSLPRTIEALPHLLELMVTNSSFLFLGCSLENDRTMPVLKRMYARYQEIPHYAVLEVPRTEAEMQERARWLAEHGIRRIIWFGRGRFDWVEAILEHTVQLAELVGTAETTVRATAMPPVTITRSSLETRETARGLMRHLGASGSSSDAQWRVYVPAIVHGLMRGRVVPFLGWGTHFGKPESEGGERPMTASELTQVLASRFEFPETWNLDLSVVTTWVAEQIGRSGLYDELREVIFREYLPRASHRFVAALSALNSSEGRGANLPVVLTANYDDTLERAFRSIDQPYQVLSYIADGLNVGKFLFRDGDGHHRVLEPGSDPLSTEITVIVKLHGGFDRDNPRREGIVVTEDDYVEYLGRGSVLQSLPSGVVSHITGAAFLFLGYGLRDWTIRVLMNRLPHREERKSWAVMHHADSVFRQLWRKRKVEVIDALLDEFVGALADSINTRLGTE